VQKKINGQDLDSTSLPHGLSWKDIPYDEENNSEFVFLCTKPLRLVIPMAISGQHKLWKLPKELHKAAIEGAVPATVL